MVNIISAKNLLNQYKAITLSDLQERKEQLSPNGKYSNCLAILESFTGFGSINSCQLCRAAKNLAKNWTEPKVFCQYCIYKDNHFDDYYCVDITYSAICNAETVEELYNAVQARIKVLSKAIRDYEDNITRIEETSIRSSDSATLEEGSVCL